MKISRIVLLAIAFIAASVFAKDKPLKPQVGTIVIGAGPAGLAAASFLLMNKQDFVVLEQASFPGGRYQLQREGENYYDAFGPTFSEPSTYLRLMADKLDMAIEYSNTQPVIASCETDLSDQTKKPSSEISMKDYLKKRIGTDAIAYHQCEQMAYHYFGTGLGDISVAQMQGAIAIKETPRVSIESGLYGREGLARVLKDAARKIGTRIRYQTQVRDIEEEEGLYIVEFKTPGSKEKIKLVAQSVILATEPNMAYKIGKDAMTSEQKKLVDSFDYGHAVSALVFSDEPLNIRSKVAENANLGLISSISMDQALETITQNHNSSIYGKDFVDVARNGYVTTIRLSPSVDNKKLFDLKETEIVSEVRGLLDTIDPKIGLKASRITANAYPKGLIVEPFDIDEKIIKAMTSERGLYLAGGYLAPNEPATANAAIQAGYAAALKSIKYLRSGVQAK